MILSILKYHGERATGCFTRLYEFKWIYQRNGRMEVSFSPGKTSNCSFSKLKTFSDAIQIPRRRCDEVFFRRRRFSCNEKSTTFSDEELLLR